MNKLDNDDQQQQQQYQNDKIAAITTTKIGIGTNTSLNENVDVVNVETNMVGLSNSHLLILAFISFFTFTIVQLIFSFVANSHAMLGDSFAMLVDSITYLMNYGAEHYKTKIYNNEDSYKNDEILVNRTKKRQQRKRILLLEIIPPFISVIALSIITILTTQQSSVTLRTELRNEDPLDTAQPNVAIMFGFSFTNLLIDLINVSCFARSKHLMKLKSKPVVDDDIVNDDDDAKQGKNINLNMCSAYTHISADTLRSIAVVTTSFILVVDDAINKSIADAIAAIIISSIILFTLIPLIHGLYCSVMELRSIYIEENTNIIDSSIDDSIDKVKVIEKNQTQQERIQEK